MLIFQQMKMQFDASNDHFDTLLITQLTILWILLAFRDESENRRIEYIKSFQFIQFCNGNYCVNKSASVQTDGINRIVSDSNTSIQ